MVHPGLLDLRLFGRRPLGPGVRVSDAAGIRRLAAETDAATDDRLAEWYAASAAATHADRPVLPGPRGPAEATWPSAPSAPSVPAVPSASSRTPVDA